MAFPPSTHQKASRRLTLNLSGAAVADGDLSTLDDHRDLTAPLGKLQHLFQGLLVFLHVDVTDGLLLGVVLPGRRREGSALLAVDQDLLSFDVSAHSFTSFP